MRKLLFIFFASILVFNKTYAIETNITDIENHWAEENIIRMLANGKVSGYKDNTFRPDKKISIIEFLKMIIEVLNIEIKEEGLNKWPDYYIATAKENQIYYDYEQNLTRYNAVEIISKLIDTSQVKKDKNIFKDLDDEHCENTLKLVKLGILNGYEDGTFRGENYMTRAEAVTIVVRTKEINKTLNKTNSNQVTYKNTNIYSRNNSENNTTYLINGEKINFSDNGRFSNVKDYSINEKYVTNKKIIKVVNVLLSNNSYTALYYAPSKYTINQIIIKYGETRNQVESNLDYFSIIFFEDKLYDLNRATLEECFSNECYMKIVLKRLWNEKYLFEKGEYIDEDIKQKLEAVLKIEFGKDYEKIIEYIIQEYKESIEKNEDIANKEIINKYIINTYKTDATSLEFYFEKLSS